MLIVDASVVATSVTDDTAAGARVRHRLGGEDLAAPHLLELEVTSVLRRKVLRGELRATRAVRALGDLAALPIELFPHSRLLGRCWELRENVTVYDAAYVALAEALDATLLTGDDTLAAATGPRCAIELLS